MATVEIRDVRKSYGPVEAIKGIDIAIRDGEFLVLLGPSGCGKSTLLRMVAGLEGITGGEIAIGGRVVNNLEPKDRDIAMVFQNYALYPHMTVADNMGFALKIAGTPKAEIRQRVEEAAKILDLSQYLDRKPKALSGGQRQRVAMGRAIVRQPQVFLMDEPLSNLDAKLRVQTRTQIASLQRRLGVTTVYVTHDQIEALTMGDRIAVLKDGLLQQVGTPREMYDVPANVFVAGFIGSPAMNIGTFPVLDGAAAVGNSRISLSRDAIGSLTDDDKGNITIGFRPEDLDGVPAGTPDSIPVYVNIVEELGSDAFVYGSLTDAFGSAAVVHSTAADSEVTVRIDPRDVPPKGSLINVRVRPHLLHLFHSGSGERITANA